MFLSGNEVKPAWFAIGDCYQGHGNEEGPRRRALSKYCIAG
jgi:hypothetical protein